MEEDQIVENDELEIDNPEIEDEIVNDEEDTASSGDSSEDAAPESNQDATDEEVDDVDKEEDRIVTIGEPAEPEEGAEEKAETPLIKKIRAANRKQEKEIRKLRKQLESQAPSGEKPIELGEKPTVKSCNYDTDRFERELEAYNDRKRKVEEQTKQQEKIKQANEKAWQEKQARYVKSKKAYAFKDYSEVEELVSDTLSQTQQGIIVEGAEDSALVTYALGKNPKKLEELAGIKNPIDFAFKVARLEAQLKVSKKKAPAPEKRVTGKAGGLSGNSDKSLERLREKAAKTGDYTEVRAYKQKMRNKE